MKIVHAASELFPYVKTGGLADAAGSLVTTLAGAGHEVAVFLPGYRGALEHPTAARAERCLSLRIEMGDQFIAGEVRRFSPRPNLTVYLICRDEWFDRRGLYGNGERDYEDNFHRFLFFQKGVIETLRLLDLRADILHCHDWQTGLLPLLTRYAERRFGATLATATVFTIHNLAFQGLFPLRSYHRTNLPDEFKGIDGVEFYGQMSLMKGGILFADRVTTVSPHYAREIQTPQFGCGLEGVVATRAEDLTGLLNGIDTEVWNPAQDALLPARYSIADLSGKAACRAELLKLAQLDATPGVPVYGMVCRLAEQKGLDLLLANKEFFLRKDVRLFVLGAGEKRYEAALRTWAAAAPGKIAIANRLDETMSHLVEAGSDFFLMPSLFEPCGLNQMYSQAYGTVPLTSRVGGLFDTVSDADAEPATGTGLTFPTTPDGLRDALARSLALFADQPRYAAVQRRGMERDFSWASAAKRYEQLYEESL
jgi:starch synthase